MQQLQQLLSIASSGSTLLSTAVHACASIKVLPNASLDNSDTTPCVIVQRLLKRQTVASPLPITFKNMMPPAKRAAAAAAVDEVLRNETLKLVLDFVGPGHCLHAATVCKAWRESYNQVAAIILAVTTWDGRSISITCGPAHTLRSAAFVSPSTLRWAHSWGLNLAVKECIAAKSASITTLALAHELGMPLTTEMMHSAARFQKFSVLEWLHIDARFPLPQDITHSAARGGSIVLLQWLAAAGCVFDRRTSYHAALAGHMHVLHFLLQKGCRFDKDCVDAAAERKDLAMVQWLLQHDCPWRSSEVVHIAAESGSVALMEWLLQEHATVMTGDLMASAAEAGQLAMCQYLREQGCPWSVGACLDAARAGHCEVVRWLHNAGCPWQLNPNISDSIVIHTAIGGSVDLLQYLLQQGVLGGGDQLTRALAAAGVYDRRAAAVWLRQHGADWPASLIFGTVPWSCDMVAWARAEGCTAPVSEQFIDPYSTSERGDAHSAASDSSDEFSSCSDTAEESCSDHNFDSDASSTLHSDDSSSDDSDEGDGAAAEEEAEEGNF
jgi:hypothetical protein